MNHKEHEGLHKGHKGLPMLSEEVPSGDWMKGESILGLLRCLLCRRLAMTVLRDGIASVIAEEVSSGDEMTDGMTVLPLSRKRFRLRRNDNQAMRSWNNEKGMPAWASFLSY